MFPLCDCLCRRKSKIFTYDICEYKLKEYKNTLNTQNIYTIKEYIENVRLLHDEVKKVGWLELLNEIELFQKIVTQKTEELLIFHRNIR